MKRIIWRGRDIIGGCDELVRHARPVTEFGVTIVVRKVVQTRYIVFVRLSFSSADSNHKQTFIRCQFVPTQVSYNALARGGPFRISGLTLTSTKTRVLQLSKSREIMTLALFVLMQYQSVTVRETDISTVAIPALA